ncbi:hypothetical protein [Paucibacter soli]|uniref:hypothetical protein n=1 Tax=Paucibacter soli TaxID=3133433 RepID=UPI0030A9B2AB
MLLVKELKAVKKDLQLQKKELAVRMKDIRTVARQRSASAATSITAILTNRKYTAAERRSIVYAKERALAPHEDAKAAIERQILAMEHDILRVESFT